MGGRAKSIVAKDAFTKRQHDALMSCAVVAYLAELEKPYHGCCGLHTICRDFEQLHLNKMGLFIPLSFATLSRLADGGHTREEANSHRHWLTTIEEDLIVSFVIEMGAHGFPLSHCCIKEHVNRIAHARLGDKFPPQGAGKNWTACFTYICCGTQSTLKWQILAHLKTNVGVLLTLTQTHTIGMVLEM